MSSASGLDGHDVRPGEDDLLGQLGLVPGLGLRLSGNFGRLGSLFLLDFGHALLLQRRALAGRVIIEGPIVRTQATPLPVHAP